MPQTVDIPNIIKEIKKPWTPVEIAHANDQVVRIALFEGAYPFHRHKNEDEIFYVIKGRITIRIKENSDVELSEGQMAIMPKNIEHSPVAHEPSYVMMFEPSSLVPTGDDSDK
jgi:mannose-6-phosphate isomerase-like protein (cupin superfamily)